VKVRALAVFISSALVLLGVSSVARAARNPAQEAAVDQDVAAVDPALVTLVHDGNAAMDRGDARTALREYAAVHDKAPNVAAITRRLCTAEARSGDPRAALVHCREAVTKQPESAENHAALATALLSLPNMATEDLMEARRESDAAEAIAPDTESSQATTCAVALRLDDTTTLGICSAKLRKLAPASPETHLYSAFALASNNDTEGAKRELEAAHAGGLDDSAYAKMRARLDKMTPQQTTAQKIGASVASAAPIVAGVWAALVFVLLVLGSLLSDAATKKKPSGFTRAVYRVVILGGVAMFHVSAAIGVIVLAGVIALVAVLFLALIGATRAVEIAFGVVGAYLVIASVRALFGRVAAPELGTPVRLKKERALREALDMITKRARMEKIDDVYVVPDATIEVRERGGVLGHLRGMNTHALVIGVAALDGLGRRAFEALVASELLRYRREGAGGDVAILERDAVEALAFRMNARGVATIANPAWWYVALYRAFFDHISEGAVEHQEDAADARAAKTYGSEELVSGLRHVARRRVEIEARTAASIHDVLDGGDAPDVYTRDPEGDLRQAIDEAQAELAERVERISALEEKGYEEGDDAPAWSLFADRKAIERAMNERLREVLRERIGLGADQPESSESTVARA
jgi:hypothetical protein